jgi:hypothetical protein
MTLMRVTKAVVASESKFRRFVESQGGTYPEQPWLGIRAKHRVVCRSGHATMARPAYLYKSNNLCKACSGSDPALAWGKFMSNVLSRGGSVVSDRWSGSKSRYHVRCSEGHDCYPTPSQVALAGFCSRCAGNSTESARSAFHRAVESLGGVVTEPEWLGSQVRHSVRCAAGHNTTALPNCVAQGQGICRYCRGKKWDALYVVRNEHTVKFGVTSGDPRQRLKDHRVQGFTDVLTVHTGLPDGVAWSIERELIELFRDCGVTPVRGREYYGAVCSDDIVRFVNQRVAKTALQGTVDAL